MSKRVLVVDDEPDLLELVALHLRGAGFEVDTAKTAVDGLRLASDVTPDLVILDIMLPDLQGTEVLRKLRQAPRTARVPVVFLTAKGDEVDRVVGFELGADDYVVKPFSPRELVLRVQALLRRAESHEEAIPAVFSQAGIRLDAHRHEVSVNGTEIELTRLEFRLLAYLMKQPGRVLSREELLQQVWGEDVFVTDRTVDTHIKRLRAKLNTDAIETVRGVGYRMKD